MAQKSENNKIPFTKKNYIIIGASIGLIIFGYFLISTEKFVDAAHFSLSLYVCPFLIAAGLIGVGYGIMYRNLRAQSEDEKGNS